VAVYNHVEYSCGIVVLSNREFVTHFQLDVIRLADS